MYHVIFYQIKQFTQFSNVLNKPGPSHYSLPAVQLMWPRLEGFSNLLVISYLCRSSSFRLEDSSPPPPANLTHSGESI